MESNNKVLGYILFVLLLSCVGYWNIVQAQPKGQVFRVTDFGAVPDGKTDSSQALLKAWDRACGVDGGLLTVPLGVFLVRGSINFEGPCIGKTYFQVRGTILASDDPFLDQEYWIQFRGIDRLTILGSGTFDGNGHLSWSHVLQGNDGKRPMSVKVIKVRDSLIKDITSVNSKRFHFHIARCSNLEVNNVDIRAPDHSPNTDGIHTGNSDNIRILNSRIGTGDDCISIGDGTRNINISRIICGPGHGISIGSIGKYENEEDVQGVEVTHCTINNADNGLRIKTWSPSWRPLTISDVTFADIRVNNVENPIFIDQYYGSNDNAESEVGISNVRFIDVRGTSATEVGLKAQCSKARPCKGVIFSGLDIKLKANGAPTVGQCSNCDHHFLGSGPQVPSNCL